MIVKNSILLCILVSMLLLLLYSGERIYLLILIIVAAVFLFCLLDLLHAVLFLKAAQSVTRATAQKNDVVKLSFKFKNRGVIPVSYIRVFYSLPLSQYEADTPTCSFSIMPFQTAGFEADILCRYRGIFRFGIEGFELRDILGLFTLKLTADRLNIKNQCELSVLPRVREMEFYTEYDGDGDGNREKTFHTSREPDAIADIRYWVPGDTLGIMHWKLSARQGEFLAKEYSQNIRRETFLFINTSPHGETELDALILEDCMVECAISCANAVLKAGNPLRCIYYTERRVALYGDGMKEFPEFFSVLAFLNFNSEFSLCDILKNELSPAISPSTIIVITPTPGEELLNRLVWLKETGHAVCAIIVPDGAGETDVQSIAEKMSEGGICCTLLDELRERREGLI